MSSLFVNAEISERMVRVFQLVPAYAHLSGAPVNKVQSFAKILLDLSYESGENSPGFSSRIGYQVPMQFCIKLFFDKAGFGLLADPASGNTFLSRCYFRVGNPLFNILELIHTCVLRPIAEELLGNFGSRGPQHMDKFIHGMFWLAASICISGVAISVDTSVYSDENVRDKIDLRFTSSVSKIFGKLISTIDTFYPYYRISSVGIEGLDRDRTWVKLYMSIFKACPTIYLEHCSHRLLPSEYRDRDYGWDRTRPI